MKLDMDYKEKTTTELIEILESKKIETKKSLVANLICFGKSADQIISDADKLLSYIYQGNLPSTHPPKTD